MPSGDRAVNFGLKAAQRIKEAVKRVENSPYPKTATSRQYPIIAGSGVSIQHAIVTNGITAATNSNSTFGKGSAQIIQMTVNANTNAATWSNSNTFVSPVTVYNFYLNTNTIAVNTHIQISQNDQGFWRYLGGDC